jgi:FKBP-type peptidyl-prolyl cis-trans isomerase
MKSTILLILATAWLSVSASAQEAPSIDDLVTPEQRVAYYIGLQWGKQLEQMDESDMQLDRSALIQGIGDAADGRVVLSDAEIAILQKEHREFQTELGIRFRAKQQRELEELEELKYKNTRESREFLSKNKSKPGVVELPSGLQYQILKPGTGRKPTGNDTVVLHQRGTLLDGTEFVSTYDRDQPLTTPLVFGIKGWLEGIRLMREGATWRLFLPPKLAYGEPGRENIGPNATLLFDVELLRIDGAPLESLTPAEQNAREGSQFLASNRNQPGVVTLRSGLQYKELRSGDGPLPRRNGKVTVHYSGRLINGTEFDSSYSRGQTERFGVTKVISGWTEALRLMPEGAHWELYIPPDLAYGKRGSSPSIGPNMTLIFEIEMIRAR